MQAHHLAAGFQQFLANVKARALNGGLCRLHRVSGGVTPGGEAAALIERHLHFHPGGILGAIPRVAARVAIVQVVAHLRLQRDGGRHLRVGVVEVSLGDVSLRPGGEYRGNQAVVRLGDIAAAGQLLRKIIADRVQAVPAEKAHQRRAGAVQAGLVLHQLGARAFDTGIGLYHVRERRSPLVVTLAGQRANGGEGLKLLFGGVDHLLPGLHLYHGDGGIVGDGVDTHQHVSLLLGHAGAFGAYLAGHLAEVVEHL